MGRKAKIKTEEGFIVEIKSTQNLAEPIAQVIDSKPIKSQLQEENKRQIYKENPPEKSSKIYKSKAKAVPVWSEKPEITDKNRDMFRKKHMEIPSFIQVPPLLKDNEEEIVKPKEGKSPKWTTETPLLENKGEEIVKKKEGKSPKLTTKKAKETQNPALSAVKKEANVQIDTAKTETAAETQIYDEPEIWLPVEVGQKGDYEVSNHGRIKSFYGKRGPILLKGKNSKHFSNVIEMNLDGRTKGFTINRLVALSFVPNPENKAFVIHKDGNHNNNYYKNLQWATQEEIWERDKPKLKERFSKINFEHAELIRSLLAKGVPQHKVAKMFCLSSMHITRIRRKESWASADS